MQLFKIHRMLNPVNEMQMMIHKKELIDYKNLRYYFKKISLLEW